MSGWTTETLKEHYDSLQSERELRYQQRFESQERALEEAKRSSERRLDGMNEFRGALTDAQKTFVTWPADNLGSMGWGDGRERLHHTRGF